MHPFDARHVAGHELTLAQQALWFLHQLAPDSSAYNVSVAVNLHFSVHVAAMASAVEQTVSAHAVLNCVFRSAGPQVRRHEGAVAGAFPALDVYELPAGEASARTFAQDLAQHPFRLDRQLPVRVALLHGAAGPDVLMVVAHHIVMDYVSQMLVLREILARYATLSLGAERAVLRTSADFDEFAAWQRSYLGSSRADSARKYWQRELTDIADGGGLPTDLRRPSAYRFAGAAVELELADDVTARVGRAAAAENATVSAYLFSAFQLLLYLFSGHTSVVIGYPVTLRPGRQFTESVGLFVNTLPFCGRLDPDDSFTALVRRTSGRLWCGLMHRDYPFALMPALASVARDPSVAGLISVMFVMTAAEPAVPLSATLVPGRRTQYAGLEISGFSIPQQLGQCDITLQVVHCGTTMRTQFKYNTSLFTEETASGLARDYAALLSAAACGTLPARLRDLGRGPGIPKQSPITGPGRRNVTKAMTNVIGLRQPDGSEPASWDQAADHPLRRLISGGWLRPSGVAGLLSFAPKFETVMARLQALLTTAGPSDSPGPCWYPPVVPLADIERAEYTQAFPHLLGTVHALPPEASAAGMPQDGARVPADVVLAPAVCYSVYPQLSDRVLEEPFFCDAMGYCYRHEATSELGRFRSFRMREFVVVADEDTAWQWRDSWITRCEALFAGLGLTFSVQPAADPFFGPGARFMSSSQIEQHLKYEFVAGVHETDPGTAIASANCHKDHLGHRFGIGLADGGPAHSSCMAFGLERTVLALIHAHGDELADWPDLA